MSVGKFHINLDSLMFFFFFLVRCSVSMTPGLDREACDNKKNIESDGDELMNRLR